MADNFVANAGTGGSTFAADDISSVLYPRTKVSWGVDGAAVDASGTNPLPIANYSRNASFAPHYGPPDAAGQTQAATDPAGAVVSRSTVLTDEGTFRINFANTSLAVSIGTITSIAGAVVTGTGFSAVDVHMQDYFKLDADGESAWVQIDSIDSDTQLTLISAYVGGTSGAASRALMRPVTGSGGSIAVASGQATLTSGTTTASVTRITRNVDVAPMVYRARLSVSQRIANQTFRIGLSESFTTADRWFARFKVDGTTNTTVICESGRNPTTTPSASETESTTVTLPNGATTTALNEYRVEQLTESCKFFINGILVAVHTKAIPAQHDQMEASVTIINGTAPASTTSVVVDYVTGKNHNKLEIGVMSDAEQIVAVQPAMQAYPYTLAGVIAINTDLQIIDCSQLRTLSIQCTSMGTTGVVTPAWSNDGVTWVNASIMTSAGVAAATFNAAGLWTTQVLARYFRLRLTTATTAGTTTLATFGYQFPIGPQIIQPISGAVTLTSGTVTTVSTLSAITAGANLIADVGLQLRANATGAATVSKFTAAATTNAANIKASAGRLVGWHLTNTTASVKYFRFFNLAVSPTMGTSSPYFVVPIPANGIATMTIPTGLAFATGISIACTGAVADLDTTVTAANDVIGSLWYA